MNIFYLDSDPVKAAQIQYNKHVVKMILESAQMLCTAHHCYGSSEQKANVPYKQAHLNHPSTIWARRSRTTYMWLYDHMLNVEIFYLYHLDIYKVMNGLNHHSVCLINIKYLDAV